MQTGTATPCGGEDGDCLKFHGMARVDAQGRTVCDVDEGGFKIAVRGVIGRAVDVAIIKAAIASGAEKQIWSLFMPIPQRSPLSMFQQDAGPEIRTMQKLCEINPSGNHHGLLVHTGVPCVGLCPELAKIHAKLVARGVTGNFVDFTAKYGLGQGVDVEDIPTLQWVVMYVTHAGKDIFNFHSRMIYDEKQDKKVRISWHVLLRGIAEFLRFADKLLHNKIFHLDVSDNNLRYRFDHAIFDDKQITITHLHFSLIDYGWPGLQPSPSRDDLLFKMPHGIFANDPPCYIMFKEHPALNTLEAGVSTVGESQKVYAQALTRAIESLHTVPDSPAAAGKAADKTGSKHTAVDAPAKIRKAVQGKYSKSEQATIDRIQKERESILEVYRRTGDVTHKFSVAWIEKYHPNGFPLWKGSSKLPKRQVIPPEMANEVLANGGAAMDVVDENVQFDDDVDDEGLV